MATHAHSGSWVHRLGRGAGRTWGGYLRREQRAAGWLVGRGVPTSAARALLWIAKLVVLGVLLYAAFWLALLLLLAMVLVWAVDNAVPEDDDEKAEWRMGLSGYGLYRGETRIDLGDPDDD
ncbi:DUF3742 family protein [Sinimarinibacterium flocculans]|uniref:Uncharacterized protein DUF3742 n=1 Tax=Sinimarinibacterium flocculans TaxID=985250 RepID=A0A318E685_9GAMM|nr:DUF3742 family protein [Sinimarinibacterium flocculans]PXV65735.1 uncharacterized protein DUF3742 [Sinimarinibacterium flocculans]